MNIETGEWWVCDYEITEIAPDIEQFHLGHLKVISTKKDSPVRFYNPLTYEGGVEYEGIGKKPYQPKTAGIDGRQPHIELARLDTANIDDILKFTSTYGLLGLWGVGKALNGLEGSDHSRTCSLSLIESFSPGGTIGYGDHFEPLDSFIAATRKFQSAYAIMQVIRDKHQGGNNIGLWSEFKSIADPYIEAISPRISRDMETGLPKIIWDFKSLINVCYYRLIQDATGGMLRNCGLEKCKLPFLAKNHDDNYCSKECRHKGTMAKLANRRIKGDLRDMEERGEIDKSLRWEAGKKAQELYDNGVRNYEELSEIINSLIEQEKSKEDK